MSILNLLGMWHKIKCFSYLVAFLVKEKGGKSRNISAGVLFLKI